MSKAIQGAAMLGGAVGMGALAFFNPALLASPMFDKIWASMIIGGLGMEAGAVAQSLTQNRGMTISTRQSAAYRQIIYGERRVGGIEVYRSTTGSHHDQFNYVIVLAGHVCDSIVGLYLDGRKVYFQGSGPGWSVRNGVGFGGNPDSATHTGPGGNNYNFGGKVYCEARYGDQAVGDVISGLTANDPTWAARAGRSPYLGGCTYVYLKVVYDTNLFPGEPEIQFTVRGKSDILDPRTGTRKFTNNWALVVADVIENSIFGLGDVGGTNVSQLIAAANVCDEQVPIAIGGTESRYTCNWAFDSAVAPGDQLSTMMPAAAGRLSYIGGEWFIWPAYWQGPSFAFDKNFLTGPLQWNPNRSARDLFNRVNGTYIAASYPYNTVGNLYDSNGFYDGTMANTFPFGFQPASYPQYAADVRHGYAADQYLAEDLGIERPFDLSQSCVLSITQAQRVAKITLLRNRSQGSGTLHMNLATWGMQEADVFQMTFPELGWTSKMLEVVKPIFTIEEGSGDEPPSLRLSFDVQETQASIYNWSVIEELTVYDAPAADQTTLLPAPPTNMILTSGASTAVTQLDGTITPRIRVEWDTPLDILTKQIQIQFQKSGDTTWMSAVPVDVSLNFAFISQVVAGSLYNVRIRSVRANGAVSVWVEIDLYTVSITFSSVGLNAVTQGALIAEAHANGTASITVLPFSAQIGTVIIPVLPSGYTINGLTQTQLWYVYYVDPTFTGGAVTPIATQNKADFLNKPGYFLIGSIITPAWAGGAGSGTGAGFYRPSGFSDWGTRSTVTPAAAYDGDVTTQAMMSAVWTAAASGGSVGQCRWEGFPKITTTTTLILYVTAEVIASTTPGLSMSVGGWIGSGATLLFLMSSSAAKATYTMFIPPDTDLSLVTVLGTIDGNSFGHPFDSTGQMKIYEIWIGP